MGKFKEYVKRKKERPNKEIRKILDEILELCELVEKKYNIKPMGFLVDNYLRLQDDLIEKVEELKDD